MLGVRRGCHYSSVMNMLARSSLVIIVSLFLVDGESFGLSPLLFAA